MIYLTLGSLMSAMALLESATRSKRISFASYLLAFFSMVLLAAIRDGVGADWDAYLNFYENPVESQRVEIGYSFINNFFSNLGIHYNAFLFFVNTVCIVLVISFLRQLGVLCVLAALLFFSDLFLYFNLSGMRQAIATAFTCFSLRYAISRNFVGFFTSVAIASAFHLSALIFVIAYFVPRHSIKGSFFVALGFLGVIGYEYMYPLAEFVTLYTSKNALYYVDTIEKADDLMTAYSVGLVRRFIVIGVALYSWKELKLHSNFLYIFNLYIIGLVIYILTYLISPDIGVRLSAYFIILDIVIFSMAILNEKSLRVRIVLTCLVCLICSYKLYGYALDSNYNYAVFF